jgi:gliding motility-associated-like protein
VASLDAQNLGANYAWSLNDTPNGNTSRTQSVDTTTPAVLVYGVTVTDPVTNCKASATRTITVKVSPSFSLSNVNPTCGSANGSLSITLNTTTPTGGPYSYSVSGPSFDQSGVDQTAPSVIGLTGLAGGTYTATVTDRGCSTTNAIGLTDAAFTADATFSNCDPSVVTVNPSGPTNGTLLYKFTSIKSGKVTGPQTSNVASLPVGDYLIQVQDNNGAGCTFVFPKTISSTVPTPTITPDLCSIPATLTADVTGGSSYTWTLPGGGTSSDAVLNVPNNGTGTYKVDVEVGSGCVVSKTIDITYKSPLTPAFTQTNSCSSSVVLSATPVGNYIYRWYKNGVLTSLGGNKVVITTEDDQQQFAVEVVDAIYGCVVRSAEKQVQVSGPVDAFVTATQACDDGKEFTLTADTNASNVAYSWFYNNSTTPITNANSATLTRIDAGNYRVRISKSNCFADASIQIIKAPLPAGELVDRVIICADRDNLDPATNQVDLNPGKFASYNWFKNESMVGYTKQIFNATSEGTYKVDLTNSFGCTSSDQTEVLNECNPKIVGPNAFRPNSSAPDYVSKFGTNSNKEFFVYSYFITDNFEIAIYNRWGELVFQSTDRSFKWNGGYNNNPSQPLPGGTYTYVIRYQSSFRPEDGVREQRGGVVLLR